jgi:hypothetical protein
MFLNQFLFFGTFTQKIKHLTVHIHLSVIGPSPIKAKVK